MKSAACAGIQQIVSHSTAPAGRNSGAAAHQRLDCDKTGNGNKKGRA
jgi:hypothetical protein